MSDWYSMNENICLWVARIKRRKNKFEREFNAHTNTNTYDAFFSHSLSRSAFDQFFCENFINNAGLCEEIKFLLKREWKWRKISFSHSHFYLLIISAYSCWLLITLRTSWAFVFPNNCLRLFTPLELTTKWE